MLVIAHAGHWAFGLLEAFPVIAVAAFAVWKTYAPSTSSDTPAAGTSVG
jgi:hypothetical protein